jgi:putative peptide zinc metalloprotease protein
LLRILLLLLTIVRNDVQMAISLHTSLTMVPVEIRKDNKNYIVEDKFSGEFYEMPKICIEAIHLIIKGEHLWEIESKLKEKYPHEKVDVLDFAAQLFELGLIAQVDGITVRRQQNQKDSLGFLWISPKAGKLFFNKFSYPLYITFFLLNLVLFSKFPSLLPYYEDIFVFDVMIINVLIWMSFTFLLVLFHEFGHILAMRAHNLPTKLEFGHRLFFVVLETDMSSVWKLAPKDRNVLYLAGLFFDNVILFTALIIQLLIPSGHAFISGLMSLVVFDIVLRMIYQCCFYLKTDLYYVFENVTGCYNLMENALQTIKKNLFFLKQKPSEQVSFLSERKTINTYAIFYFLGIAISIALYFIFYIPEVIHAGKLLLPGFGQAPTSLAFWDAVIFTLQVSIFLLLLLYSYWKKYRPIKM